MGIRFVPTSRAQHLVSPRDRVKGRFGGLAGASAVTEIIEEPIEVQQEVLIPEENVVQEENQGSLTIPLMDAVAAYLDLPTIAVYEVATFYTMYYLDPVGNHVINLCTNVSCRLNGADKILAYLKERLGIELNETTNDGRFTLKEVECLGACVAAPACHIGKRYYENLTPEKIDEILDALA